ncbi:Putative addiction module component [Nannocystis exedens]|uniref:Putative addiction module component n=1 Tax=Nannocystis exedens TaxID=54 RepID=A0A1I1VVD1_9BACT|nr:addiction module protein [Nannocystis exedens]PCC72876.1 hypothetical protein NAEX_05962 [Nannocystis exedens]SFD86861.1 Putative addiction module component [Nannocystis exedens]
MTDRNAKCFASAPGSPARPASVESPDLPHEDAWLAEVERRWHAIESGLEATVDHEEALAFIFAAPLTRPSPAR